jgi:hypothetical protein
MSTQIPAVEMQRLFARTEEWMMSHHGTESADIQAMNDLFRRTKELTIELMRDNEQLRVQNLVLERQKIEAEQRLDQSRLGKENEQLRNELEVMNQRVAEMEQKSQKFRRRYEDIEQYNMALSNVYIATNRLHSTLDFTAVVKMAEEILWNFVASPSFAIFLRDDKSSDLKLVGGQGIDGRFPSDVLHDPTGMIAECANNGVSLFIEDITAAEPLACVPLKIEHRIVGVVAVYRIEEHKGGLSNLDKELFELLANQTATAMTSSRVYSETVKKLKSMESFLSLIKAEYP